MFELIYAKSVSKDIKPIPAKHLTQIKQNIEALKHFPDIPHIKHLSNHPVADYRLRIGQYRVLFDVDWNKHQILILKIGHRSRIYQ